ncbi:MAG: signal peptidase I [Actinobacteria bacterium]|nr:signal peptidase I [Actinomycetota bacterium]
MPAPRSIWRRLAGLAGWAVVAAGVALALAIAGPIALGDHPLTDLSGSMEPAISPGDVVIDEEIAPGEARVGDVVTFRDPEDQAKQLTHRVVSVRREGAHLWFVTKGDANNTREHWRVAADGQIGRVLYTVPWVGHVAVLARTPLGWALLVGVPLLLVAGEELVRIWRPRPRPPSGKEGDAVGGAG